MSDWAALAWWVGINIALGIFGPVIVGSLFVEYSKPKPKITLRKFYEKGELGLASMLISLTVIVEIRKSHFSANVIEMVVFVLSVFVLASAHVWAVPLCNNLVKAGTDWDLVWSRSWRIALATFMVCFFAEVWLALSSQVASEALRIPQ